jgi:hypothetical protein
LNYFFALLAQPQPTVFDDVQELMAVAMTSTIMEVVNSFFMTGNDLVRNCFWLEVMFSCASNPLRRCSVQTRLMHTT